MSLANKYLIEIRKNTETVSEGEGVSMLLLWAFLMDHAECKGMDVEELAHHQLKKFIEFAKENDIFITVENKKTIN